jgi:hypothetical protein
MNIIVINLIADALDLYGPDIRPYRETFHKSVINYGSCVTLFFYTGDKLRRVTYVV